MTNLSSIKYILFDVGNVLVYKVTHEDQNVAELVNLSREEYRELLDRVIKEQTPEEKSLFKNMNTLEKEISYLNMLHAKVCKELKIQPTNDLITKMTRCRTQGNFAIKEGVLNGLEILSKEYKLGILSNAPPSRRHHELKLENIDRFFDHIFISKEIGLSKPNPGIYKYVLENIGYTQEEVLFVDDKIDYLDGAKEEGFSKLIYYLKDNKENLDSNYQTINSFNELITLLDKE
jgi:HAD superfamily hydrolase (TIGR01509 family)